MKSNVSSVGPSSERNSNARANARNVRLYYPSIGSTPTFLYFDLYLYAAYAAHYVYSVRNGLVGTYKDPSYFLGTMISVFAIIILVFSYYTSETDGQKGIGESWLNM